jgi:hypothetical protein
MRTLLLALCLFVLASACRRPQLPVEEIAVEPFGTPVERKFTGKAQVKIDLQGGFSENGVLIFVDGRKKFSKTVTTNPATGLAARLEFAWEKPELLLGVIVEDQKQEWRCKLDLKSGTNIGVNRIEGRVRIIQSDTPFGYF